MHRQVRQLIVAGAILAALAACKRSESEAPPAGRASSAGGSGAAKGGAPAFTASVSAPPSLQAGTQGELVIEVAAREGYKVNSEYPHTFRPNEGGTGVRFDTGRYELWGAAERVPCKDGKAEDVCALRARVPFTALAPGTHELGGVVALSVCNPDICLIEKIPVTASIQAR